MYIVPFYVTGWKCIEPFHLLFQTLDPLHICSKIFLRKDFYILFFTLVHLMRQCRQEAILPCTSLRVAQFPHKYTTPIREWDQVWNVPKSQTSTHRRPETQSRRSLSRWCVRKGTGSALGNQPMLHKLQLLSSGIFPTGGTKVNMWEKK